MIGYNGGERHMLKFVVAIGDAVQNEMSSISHPTQQF